MTISATELKSNLGKYLDMVIDEDILITKNGKVIAQITMPKSDKLDILESLCGIAKQVSASSLDDIRKERLNKQ